MAHDDDRLPLCTGVDSLGAEARVEEAPGFQHDGDDFSTTATKGTKSTKTEHELTKWCLAWCFVIVVVLVPVSRARDQGWKARNPRNLMP